MNSRLNDLQLRRGRLLERIASQRAALGRDTQPLRAALYPTDRLLTRLRNGVNYVKQHPSIAALAVAALFIMKADRVWHWAKCGFVAWQTWRTFSNKLSVFGLPERS